MTKASVRIIALVLLLVLAGLWLRHWWQGRPPVLLQGLPAVMKGEAPIHPGTPTVRFPQPSILTLSNGLRVFVIEDHRQPYVQCALSLPAGTLEEPKRGLAALTAAMMLEGTERHTEPQMAAAVEQRGMTLSVYADLETTTLRCGGAASDFPQLIGLASEALLHPAFPQGRLVRLQQIAAENWQRTHSNTDAITKKVTGRLLYGNTPYGQPAATLAENDALDRPNLIGFYQRCYRPNGAVLGVIGDVTAASVRQQLTAALSSWKTVDSPVSIPPLDFPPPAPGGVHILDWSGASDSWLYFETLTVARSSPDYVPLLVANRIFGGASSSRLFQNLRETQGLTYGAYSALDATNWPSLWYARVSVPYAQTAAAVRGVLGELQRLSDETASPEELDRAQRGLIGSLAVSLNDPGNVLNMEMDLIRNGLPPDYWQTYRRQIQSVTSADVQRVAKRYLGKGVQVIIIGPRGKIVDGLRPLGPIDDLNDLGDPVH